jgi:hypothetical protein
MTQKKSSNRGCVGLLATSGFAFGALACAWSFYLGTARAGEPVSLATGLSFYAGWVCGMGFVLFGILFSVLSFFMQAAGNIVDNMGDGDGQAEWSDLVPGNLLGGGGGLAGLVGGTVISRFFNNRK